MTSNSYTLLDLMIMLPNLHPRHLADLNVTSISTLRLVSKDIGNLALTAVQRCSVHLGVKEARPRCPQPKQVARLITDAQLQQLYVTLSIVSGAEVPNVDEQLSSCMHQIDCLVSRMSRGIKSVTGLTLQVNYQQVGAVQKSAPEVLPDGSVRSGEFLTPDRFRVVPSSVFAALAPAVPNLQLLGLQGFCWDAALSAFGTSCPRLITLCVQALQVPVMALQGLANHLPNITSLSIGSAHIQSTDKQQLGTYIDAVLCELGECSNLTSLCLSIPGDVWLVCKPSSWLFLPASLQQLEITCEVANSNPYTAVANRMKILRLSSSPLDLSNLLEENPLLERLETLGEAAVTVSCAESDDSSMDHLKQRLWNGTFQLACRALSFWGTCKEIQDTLVWFPQAPSCKLVTVHVLQGGEYADCLEHLAERVPGVTCLTLAGCMSAAQTTDMDMAFFSPLSDFPNLTEVRISCQRLVLTMSGLLQLCASLESLCKLGLSRDSGVDANQLGSRFRKLGRKITVHRL